MQNLSNAFDLNQKYIFLKKRFLTLLFVMFVPLLLQAVDGSPSCPDSAANQYAILGDQYLPGPTSAETGSVAKLSSLYHQLLIPADGNITITYENDGNKDLIFSTGTGCNSTFYNTETVSGGAIFPVTSPSIIPVTQGQIIYFRVQNPNTNAQAYKIKVNYDSAIILASISPSEFTIPKGITPVYLDVTLNRGAINGDLNVTYLNTYDNSINHFIIDKWYDTYQLRIDINISDPGLVVGSDFNITLLSAEDTSGYETGIITEDNTSTITIGDPMADLAVVKGDSKDPVRIGESFYYAIAVSNYGSAPASNVTVVDSLPNDYLDFVDIDVTNSNSPGWNCYKQEATESVICNFDGNLTDGAIEVIQIHLTLPVDTDLIGTVENRASVTSDADYDIRNDEDYETTRIVAEDYDEINQVLEICYTDTTIDTMLAAGFSESYINKNCKKVGNFYYSNGCTATVDIIVDQNLSTGILESVHLTKMYAPEIVNGTCDTELGTCSGFQDIYIEESPSYTKGYEFELGTVPADSNITITDYDSYNGNPNNPKDQAGIGIYATYKYAGVYHYGRVYDCEGVAESGVEITTSADAIDTEILDAGDAQVYNESNDTSYDLDTPPTKLKWIQTRVASDQREIVGVHLDKDTKETKPYEFEDNTNYSPFIIIPYLVDNTSQNQCGLDSEPLFDETGAPLVITVENYQYSGTKIMALPNIARKDARLQLIYIDPNSLSDEGKKCLANSSTGGNLEGIGQCGNSEIQYVGGFGIDAWDRCGINNGKPCLSSHHGYSGGGNESYPGYNPLYDNVLGCYMCTFNIKPACSTDNFAIRPDYMDLNMTHADAPDLLRAGREYEVALTARDKLGDIDEEYTVVDHKYNTDLAANAIKYFNNPPIRTRDDVIGDGNDLSGTFELNASNDAYMVEGLSSENIAGPGVAGIADEVVRVYYSDVGYVGLQIYDHEWAEVDNDDTPMDCESETHTYVCAERNVTYIPNSFRVDNIVLRNHRDGNFTYLSNDLNMSSHLDVTISALNAQGTITRNFRQGSLYYENPVSVDVNVTEWNPSLSNKHPLNNDQVVHDIPTARMLGFGGDDANGTHSIAWNDSNLTQRLSFNYKRDNNQPVNPFEVPEGDVNISVASTYTSVDGTNQAVITGTGVENDDVKAKFYFGRAKASQDFYDVEGTEVLTPITMLIYCDVFPTCALFPDDIQLTGQTNLNNWWLSLDHNETLGDGNITLANPPTLVLGNGSATVTPDVNIVSNAQDDSIVVNRTGGTGSATFDILFNVSTPTSTNSWVIYNADSAVNAPNPFYKVRFTGESGWAGVGETGHVLDINASTTKTKRLNW